MEDMDGVYGSWLYFKLWIWKNAAKKIKFTQKIELYKLPVKGEDMMIIMGNLLENAMEASMKCQIEERRIELTIQQIMKLFLGCEKFNFRYS